MVISDELFNYREDLLAECLRAYGLEEGLVQRVREIDECFRKQIVKSSPRERSFRGKKLPLKGYEPLELLVGSMLRSA